MPRSHRFKRRFHRLEIAWDLGPSTDTGRHSQPGGTEHCVELTRDRELMIRHRLELLYGFDPANIRPR